MSTDPATPPAAPSMSPPAHLVHGLIRVYQWLFAWRPSPCRYVPTCSSYALEAVEVHGFARGGWLAVRRLGRCHPWGSHGADPVPPRGAARGNTSADHSACNPSTPKAA